MIKDYTRLAGLMDGTLEPQDKGESLFVMAYDHAVEGELLMRFMLDNAEQLDHCDLYDITMINLGYAMGQHDFTQANEELLGITNEDPNDDDTFH